MKMSCPFLWATKSKQLGLEVHRWDSWKPAFSRIDSVASRISAFFIICPQVYEAFGGPHINLYRWLVLFSLFVIRNFCVRACHQTPTTSPPLFREMHQSIKDILVVWKRLFQLPVLTCNGQVLIHSHFKEQVFNLGVLISGNLTSHMNKKEQKKGGWI